MNDEITEHFRKMADLLNARLKRRGISQEELDALAAATRERFRQLGEELVDVWPDGTLSAELSPSDIERLLSQERP